MSRSYLKRDCKKDLDAGWSVQVESLALKVSHWLMDVESPGSITGGIRGGSIQSMLYEFADYVGKWLFEALAAFVAGVVIWFLGQHTGSPPPSPPEGSLPPAVPAVPPPVGDVTIRRRIGWPHVCLGSVAAFFFAFFLQSYAAGPGVPEDGSETLLDQATREITGSDPNPNPVRVIEVMDWRSGELADTEDGGLALPSALEVPDLPLESSDRDPDGQPMEEAPGPPQGGSAERNGGSLYPMSPESRHHPFQVEPIELMIDEVGTEDGEGTADGVPEPRVDLPAPRLQEEASSFDPQMSMGEWIDVVAPSAAEEHRFAQPDWIPIHKRPPLEGRRLVLEVLIEADGTPRVISIESGDLPPWVVEGQIERITNGDWLATGHSRKVILNVVLQWDR